MLSTTCDRSPTKVDLPVTAQVALTTDLLTCEEAAAFLRVHPRTVYRLLREGKLPGVKVGRQWRIRRTDLEASLGPPGMADPSPASPVKR